MAVRLSRQVVKQDLLSDQQLAIIVQCIRPWLHHRFRHPRVHRVELLRLLEGIELTHMFLITDVIQTHYRMPLALSRLKVGIQRRRRWVRVEGMNGSFGKVTHHLYG
jgi:hypothetical protein